MKTTIIFDLDRTLVDSLDDSPNCGQRNFAGFTRPALSALQSAPMIGDGARALLQRALNSTGGVPQNFSQLLAGFLEL